MFKRVTFLAVLPLGLLGVIHPDSLLLIATASLSVMAWQEAMRVAPEAPQASEAPRIS
jgi:hypothetical protein